MGDVRKRFLIGLSLLAVLPGLEARKFYPDDPLWREPAPVPVSEPKKRKVDDAYDMIQKLFFTPAEREAGKIPPAGAVNTLGEVPDSAWYQNRHGTHPMTLEELRRGPGNRRPPAEGTWTILSAKTEGATPGFVIQDSAGRRYVCKFDPKSNPNMTTGADVIGSKFFYALGYNVPENYIVRFERTRLRISPKAGFIDRFGRERPMNEHDLEDILSIVPREPDGRFRALASLFIEGEILGPFLFHGTRTDDPNDIVPHEDRRDLRGYYVYSAWLNHYDATSLNTLDAVVSEGGSRYIRHHLIDFGSMLGASALGPRSVRSGNVYLFDWKPAVAQFFTLGFHVPDWHRARYPEIPEVGRLEAEVFDPRDWKPIYPNPAFENRLSADTYWAAKKVMAFTDAQIRAVVETGEFRDPKAVDWMTEALARRRDKIGWAFFSDVLPLDDFEVRDGRLEFEDLAVRYDFSPPRRLQVRWARFDNEAERHTPIPGEDSFRLPAEAQRAAPGAYYSAEIRSQGAERTVTVYLRREPDRLAVVGIERR